MPWILKTFLGFEAQNLKGLGLPCASEHCNFKQHDDFGKINNSNKSNYLHANVFRDTTCIPGNYPQSKPNVDLPFDSNPPMNELIFLDGYSREKWFCMKK